jgi:hypothetical protein
MTYTNNDQRTQLKDAVLELKEWNDLGILYSERISEIIQELGLEITRELKNKGVGLHLIDGYDAAEVIVRFGIEALPHLEEIGFNPRNLESNNLASILYNDTIFDEKSLLVLKEFGADFSKLDINGLILPIMKHGIKMASLLGKLGADINLLSHGGIESVACKHGIDMLFTLKEFGADFSNMGSLNIAIIVATFGIDSAKTLKKLGADLTKLDANGLSLIIITQGIDTLVDLQNLGSTTIGNYSILEEYKTNPSFVFKETIGADFSTLDEDEASLVIIHCKGQNMLVLKELGLNFTGNDSAIFVALLREGKEIVPALKHLGADFGKMESVGFVTLIEKHGTELISTLKDFNANVQDISYDNMIRLSNIYGEKILDELFSSTFSCANEEMNNNPLITYLGICQINDVEL